MAVRQRRSGAARSRAKPSPVFETPYGFHIVRVDRRADGRSEGAADSDRAGDRLSDVARTQELADSVAKLWKAGTPFDSLAKKYHDYAGKEETSILTPFWRDSLPAAYQKRRSLLRKAGDIVTFQIPGSAQRPDDSEIRRRAAVDGRTRAANARSPKCVRPCAAELAQRGGVRRYVDRLRKQTYRLRAPQESYRRGRMQQTEVRNA